MGIKKIVITGGPGTGKSSIINALLAQKQACMEEISRTVTLQAQQEGITQLFLTQPLLFSERLLEGRRLQYKTASTMPHDIVFFDRGIHDVLAYLEYSNTPYPSHFKTAALRTTYDAVFILKPWEAIYKTDNERYESFAQAQQIHQHILKTYNAYHYTPIDVPFGTVKDRSAFILNTLELQ